MENLMFHTKTQSHKENSGNLQFAFSNLQLGNMKPLRIVILSEDFPPYAGGIAQWAHGVATSLHQLGHQVSVVTRYRRSFVPFRHPFPLHFMHGGHWKQLRTWYCRRAIRDLYRRGERPAVIIATTWNCARGILTIAHRHGTRVVIIVHGLEVTRTMPFLKRWWLKRTLRASHQVIAVSDFTRRAILDACHLPPERVTVVPNGVQVQDFFPGADTTELRRKYNLTDEKVVLTLARVIERKGHDQVIKALPQVMKKIPRLKYFICGPWNEAWYLRLQLLVRDLGLENTVIFTGYIATHQLNELYNLCDVYVMPSRELAGPGDTEGFGITFLEANACEKPVIGGKSGGVGDAIADGETGFLVDPLDTEALAQKIIRVLEDPALARSMGRRGRERIDKGFTWEAVTGKIINSISWAKPGV
jgi:phosphatidylinositol alpha-1,6-mannosyltransferase